MLYLSVNNREEKASRKRDVVWLYQGKQQTTVVPAYTTEPTIFLSFKIFNIPIKIRIDNVKICGGSASNG